MEGEQIWLWSRTDVGYVELSFGGEVEKLSAIFDDDKSKDKTHYQNLNVEIQSSNHLIDSGSNLILVTSMENQRRVRARLMDFPKSTIIGFQVG